MQSDSHEIIFNVIKCFFSLQLTRHPAGCCCNGVLLDGPAVLHGVEKFWGVRCPLVRSGQHSSALPRLVAPLPRRRQVARLGNNRGGQSLAGTFALQL